MEVGSLSIRIPVRENSFQGCIILGRDRNPPCSVDDFHSVKGDKERPKDCVVLHVAVGESWGFDGSESR